MSSAPTIPGVNGLVEIGRGGFGIVWGGIDSDGRQVAVKVARQVTHAPRLAREIEALRQIGPPHVPELYATGKLDDGRPYIVMERLEGETLGSRVKAQSGPMPTDVALEIVGQLLDCLDAVHQSGVVHRDLKPANIFLTSAGVRVMDFGLARFDDGIDLTRTGVIVGTVAYASPEQLAGDKTIDGRADLYSVGVILYQLLTEKLPFEGDRAEVERGHLMLRPPSLSANIETSSALDELLEELLAKDPQRRPARAADVKSALATIDREPTDRTPSVEKKRLGGGAEPVVLLAASGLEQSSVETGAIIERNRGFVARERAGRIVAVFTARASQDPVASASAAARELRSCGFEDVVLHIDEVLVRAKPGAAATAYGKSLEAPADWMSLASGEGIRVTDQLAAVAPSLLEDGELKEPPFVGHAELIEELERVIDSALAGSAELVTLLGAPGVGKTRLASEAALRAEAAGAQVIRLTGRAATAASVTLQLGGAPTIGGRLEAMRAASDMIRKAANREPLALVVDDAQLAGLALLDSIELALAESDGLRLLVVVCADTGLDDARPEFGKRADRFRNLSIPPLDQEAASELAAFHLQPAEYPPAQVLRRLAAWSGCNPRLLGELVRSLKARGAIAKRANADSYYVVTEVLDELPTSLAAQWLESQKLDAMSPDLAAFARLAALTGSMVDVDELDWVLRRVDRYGGAATRIDPSVGAAELAVCGWLVNIGEHEYEWAREATRDAIYNLIRPKDRETLHSHALAYARAVGDPVRIARHAAAVGERTAAATALLELATRAQEKRSYVAAEQFASRAIEISSQRSEVRLRALIQRGIARYHFNRAMEAVADLEEAIDLATEIDDMPSLHDALIACSTAHDWQYDFDASEGCLERALGLALPPDSWRSARERVARARTAWRRDRAEEAAGLLGEVIPQCRENGDLEYETIARVLYPMALVVAGRTAEGEKEFQRSLRFCSENGDGLHLAAVHANRIILWEEDGRIEEGVDDLERAVRFAREAGHPIIEVAATHNLAELQFWIGNDEVALSLGTRSLLLQRRFFNPVPMAGPLLLARVLVAKGEQEQAQPHLKEAAALTRSGTPADVLVLAALQAGRPWDVLVAEARELQIPELEIEICYYAARSLAQAGEDPSEFVRAARVLVEARPIWSARVAEISRAGR